MIEQILQYLPKKHSRLSISLETLQGFTGSFSESNSSWVIFIESTNLRETARRNVSRSPENRNWG